MIHHTLQLIEAIGTLGTLSGVGYYTLCLWGAANFLRETAGEPTPGEQLPPVSILKPLKGTDPEMLESLRSHCRLDYPEYEIIFGVSQADDPAVELVRQLTAEFPNRVIRLVICRKDLGANTKVSNLAQMLAEAIYQHLVVNDSDIRVEPGYLRQVIAPLSDAKIGMVTCLYRGIAGPTLGSRLESLGISTDFAGGVLAARVVERGLHFGLGSTLAFRRRDLQAIGGFEAIVDYLADDYELGKRIAERGLEVKLSEVVVETFVPAYSMREFFEHQLRWARSLRNSRRWGYAGLVLTFGLPWALLVLALIRGTWWAWELLAVTALTRAVLALVVGRWVVQDRQVVRWLPLVPLRDIAGLFVWIASFMGHRIQWRGNYFTLKDGKLARTEIQPGRISGF